MTTVLPPPVASRRSQIGQHFLLLLCFVGSALLIMPLSLFVFDNDEGINVIKAVLMGDGYGLYTQTWSDQPPVFTQLLQWSFALFGAQIVVARLLVLALTTLFIWAYTSTIRLHLGMAGAWVALLLLLLSDNFLRLSVSVMIGLPALSFAMVAIYLLQRYHRNPARWLLVGAGLLMALSMQTKFYTAVIAPVLFFDLLDFGQRWRSDPTRLWQQLRAALLWTIVTGLGYLAIGFYYQAFDLAMLFGAHLSPTVQAAYAADGGPQALLRYLLFDYGHLLAGALGIGVIWARRLGHGRLPLGWLLLALLLLSNHHPLWYHHYQLLAIPLCWLGAYAVLLLPTQPRPQALRMALPVVVLLVALIVLRAERTVPDYNQRDYDRELVALLAADAPTTHWVFADQAIYPFYARLPVPPEIAVFSRKRFFGENLNNQILLDVMQRYQPEQVLLTRFKDDLLADPEFAGYLAAHYTKVQEVPDYAYYRLQR